MRVGSGMHYSPIVMYWHLSHLSLPSSHESDSEKWPLRNPIFSIPLILLLQLRRSMMDMRAPLVPRSKPTIISRLHHDPWPGASSGEGGGGLHYVMNTFPWRLCINRASWHEGTATIVNIQRRDGGRWWWRHCEATHCPLARCDLISNRCGAPIGSFSSPS